MGRNRRPSLKTTWQHPLGGTIRVDAALIDSGDGDHAPHVYSFVRTRFSRRVAAAKGNERLFARPSYPIDDEGCSSVYCRLGLGQNSLFNRLAGGIGMRFSADLEPRYFEELVSERRVVRYSRGQPTKAFERIQGRLGRCLDATVYAVAARNLIAADVERREAELSTVAALPKTVPNVVRVAGWTADTNAQYFR